jgi:periplasmic protein TonB
MIARWTFLLFTAAATLLAPSAAAPQAPPELDKTTWAATVDYSRRIAAHTQRFREYPRMGRLPAFEGTVVVKVIIARDGRVVDVQVAQSSGYSLIDGAELGAFWRSSPLPPPPAEIVGDHPTVTIMQPVNYQIRQ